MKLHLVREDAFAGACLEAVLDAVQPYRSPLTGLPTGSTPLGLYAALRRAVSVWDADVSSWRPIAIDEYGGPRDHACSNRAYFAEHWDAIRGAAPVEQFDPEAADLEAECARMRAVIDANGGLDLAILGVGLNGHLAFNEPGSSVASSVRRMDLHADSRASARSCWGDATPAWGLTLGLRELLGARRVVVMANGAAKASVVAQALAGAQSAECPATFARGEHVVWVVDEGAARELQRSGG